MWARIDGMRTLELGSPGEMRGRLNALVLAGRKRATLGLESEYTAEGEEFEHAGERLALVDDHGARIAVVEVRTVTRSRFGDVPWDFAHAESEGHADLAEWREGHLRYYARVGESVDDDTPVVQIRMHLLPDA